MYNGRLVKLLEVDDEDKDDYGVGFTKGMVMSEGKYGIVEYYDDDDNTYMVQTPYGDYWYLDDMLELVTTITSNNYSVGDKLIPKEINISDCDLPCGNEYTGKEGTIVNVYEGDIIELEFEDGGKNFYFSHYLSKTTEYNAF